jgi:5-methylcytosine-specific restriction endonuclease McrA
MIRIKYTKELLETNVKDCYSFAELCRRLGLKPEGSNPKTLRKKMDEFGVDYSHFTGQAWNKNPENPVYRGKYLPKLCEHSSLNSSNAKELVYRLSLKENKCEICGITEWQGKPIICELHHINGDSTDNRLENLQILCPNCHSQTDNFRSRNRNRKVMSAQKETSEVEAG